MKIRIGLSKNLYFVESDYITSIVDLIIVSTILSPYCQKRDVVKNGMHSAKLLFTKQQR